MSQITARFNYIFLLLWACLILAGSATAASSSEEKVQKAYQDWCAAISTAKGHPEELEKFYAPNALLLPTLSSKIKVNNQGGLDSYFTSLTSYPDIKCTTDQLITGIYGSFAINTGLRIDDRN